MIVIERTDTYGWEAAIRGMRNPMDSWGSSDSKLCMDSECCECYAGGDATDLCSLAWSTGFAMGKADMALAVKLAKAGAEHRKFMRMITVTCDITAPMYWWAEADTYKVGTVRNSCSKMHTIHKKPFVIDDFSHEHLLPESEALLADIVKDLNECRAWYENSGDKDYWWQLIQLLPSSYNQRSTVQTNYETLANIYRQRRNHKLDEWRDFCKWIEKLPYGELITGGSDE